MKDIVIDVDQAHGEDAEARHSHDALFWECDEVERPR
jgi:hypothetical protein